MLADIPKDKTQYLWTTGTVLAVAYPIFVAVWHDISRSYTITPDADLVYLAEALRFVDGLSQRYFDHPAHTYIMGLGLWLKTFFLFGLSPDPSHNFAVKVQDIDTHIQALTITARYLSAVVCACFVGFVIWGTKQLNRSLPIAIMAGLIFSTSEGIATHAVILRAELWSAFGLVAAFFFLLIADRSYGRKQLWYLALAGFSVMISLESKIQSIIPLLGMPILILAQVERRETKLNYLKWGQIAAPLFFAVAVIIPMFILLTFSVIDGSSKWLGGIVLFLIMSYVTGSMFLYGYWKNISITEQLVGAVALALGLALGTYLLFFWHSYKVLDLMVHFIDHTMVFSSLAHEEKSLSTTYIGDILYQIVQRRISNTYLPIHLMEIFALCMIGYLGFKNLWRKALMVLLLLGFSLSIETAFGLRGFPSRYLIYTEIWIILALFINARELFHGTNTRNRRFCLILLVPIIAWNINIGLGEQIVPKQIKSNVCGQAQGYLAPELANRFQHYCN